MARACDATAGGWRATCTGVLVPEVRAARRIRIIRVASSALSFSDRFFAGEFISPTAVQDQDIPYKAIFHFCHKTS